MTTLLGVLFIPYRTSPIQSAITGRSPSPPSADDPCREVGAGARSYFFLRPTELERLATLRLVSTLSTVPIFRYFERTLSRIASRWS
ncbi:MAG: hypothetical protein RLZZ34_115 [Verrucomicrobiota bacterium]